MPKFHKPLFGRVYFRWNNGLPQLLLWENHEPVVKWLSRGLTLIGLATVWLSIEAWELNLLISLTLLAVEQFIERTVFAYGVEIPVPLPSFDWQQMDGWEGLIFGNLDKAEPSIPLMLGLSFSDRVFGLKVFRLFTEWHNFPNGPDDRHLNISMVLDEEFYYFFAYPTVSGPDFDEIVEAAERATFDKHRGKQMMPLTAQFILCKRFNRGPGKSGPELFQDAKSPEDPYIIVPLDAASPRSGPINDVQPVWKTTLRVLALDDLTDEDLEKFHLINNVQDLGIKNLV